MGNMLWSSWWGLGTCVDVQRLVGTDMSDLEGGNSLFELGKGDLVEQWLGRWLVVWVVAMVVLFYSTCKLGLANSKGWIPQTPLGWNQENASWYLHLESVLWISVGAEEICEDRNLPQSNKDYYIVKWFLPINYVIEVFPLYIWCTIGCFMFSYYAWSNG